MNVFEIFGKLALTGADKVEGELEKVTSTAQKVTTGLKVAGVAFTAAGAAGLKLVSDAKEVNASLSSTAITLGTTTKDMRDLTLATTNVTFPIDSVVKTFDVLTKAGVRNTEELQKSAFAFDALADAVGSNAETVADQLIPVFKAFGQELPQTAGELDKFTWLAKNTSIDIGEFATTMTRLAPEMQAAGTSIDDAQMVLAILNERGITGRVAITELNEAVRRSVENHTQLAAEIGVTHDELMNYESGIKEATGLTDKHAEAMTSNVTIMDKLKQKFSEIALDAGSFLTQLEPVLAVMTALGPAMVFLSSQIGIATIKTIAHTAWLVAHGIAINAVAAAQWLWNIAMGANPIGLIILGIVALIAGVVLLVKNWEKVAEFFTELWEKLKAGFSKMVDNFKSFFSGFWEFLKEGFGKLVNILMTPFKIYFTFLKTGVNWLIDMLNKIKISIPDWVPFIGGKSFGINLPHIDLPDFLDKWAAGGVIREPTLLSRLSDMKPYAIAGEAGPETISPGRGFNAANIYVLLDGRVLAKALGQPLVDEIRLTTGVKI